MRYRVAVIIPTKTSRAAATEAMMITTIIFDLDGVLVDATEWHYTALNQALQVFGYPPIARADHLARFNGLPTREKLALLGITGRLASLVESLKKHYTHQLIHAHARPDYAKCMLVRSLARQYTLAVVSNARYHSVIQMLNATGIDLEQFEMILGGDSACRPKPAPDLYLKVFGELGVGPDQCVIVEDSPPGIAAAHAAGSRVIEVTGVAAVNSGLFIKEGLL